MLGKTRNRRERVTTDPMTQEMSGEAWALAPLEFPEDPNGDNLRRAARFIQALTTPQAEMLIRLASPPHVNANHYQ